MFENQMKKKSVARNGNHLVAIFESRLSPAMFFLVRS